MKRFICIAGIGFLAIASCKKESTPQDVLHSLYNSYKNGQIEACRLNGQLVYTGEQNDYDAGATIYDSTGKSIGHCNYAWGQVDSICRRLQSCEVIYRCKEHISGEPFVDKYGLSE